MVCAQGLQVQSRYLPHILRDELVQAMERYRAIAAAGILTARGGKTSHAAVVARGMGTTCVCGAEALDVDPLDWILSGGEDHGFAATFGPEVEIPSGWIVIGEVAAGSGVSVDGSLRESGGGWHSFSTTGTTAV